MALTAGAFEPFDEGAAQVQRLLKRDRKELTGESSVPDIVKSEFDESPPTEASTSKSASEPGLSHLKSFSRRIFRTPMPMSVRIV